MTSHGIYALLLKTMEVVMHGIIKFTSAKELAQFLKEFTGSTATFHATQKTEGTFELEFTGGF